MTNYVCRCAEKPLQSECTHFSLLLTSCFISPDTSLGVEYYTYSKIFTTNKYLKAFVPVQSLRAELLRDPVPNWSWVLQEVPAQIWS